MSKQLMFNHKGVDYTLEYTRKSVAAMEKQGFVANDITTRPMSVLPELFAGAFIAHHRFVKREIIDEIFDKMTNKTELIGKLSEMYNEPIMTLINEPDEAEGNVSWTASW